MNRIIKDFSSWKLFEAGEPQDAAALYKAGDLAGLVALVKANDSAAVKSKPGYDAVMQWWSQGHGDLGLIKGLLKSGSARQGDKTNSLKSAYYWSGSSSNVNATGLVSGLLTAMKAVAANKAKVDAWIATAKGNKASYSSEWIDSLGETIQKIEDYQKAGSMITPNATWYIFPPSLKDNMLDKTKVSDSLESETPNPSILRILAQFKPTKQFSEIEAERTKPDTALWKASAQISEADKLKLMDVIAAKAQKHADRINKSKPGTLDLTKSIMTASDLYVMPQNVEFKVTAAEAPAAPTSVTASFSYPANPNGDENSPEFKKGLQLFPDDGTTVGPEATAAINQAVTEAVKKIQEQGGTITGVQTYGYSSTSKVPTKYGSDSATYNPANNVRLANDRLAAINATLAQAIKTAGVQVEPTVDAAKNVAVPNHPNSPDWGDAQRKDSAKYGTPGKRTAQYEAEYGKWRFAAAFFTFTYTVTTTTPNQPGTDVSVVGQWKAVMHWSDESISISIPRISIGGSFPSAPRPKKSSTACPVF